MTQTVTALAAGEPAGVELLMVGEKQLHGGSGSCSRGQDRARSREALQHKESDRAPDHAVGAARDLGDQSDGGGDSDSDGAVDASDCDSVGASYSDSDVERGDALSVKDSESDGDDNRPPAKRWGMLRRRVQNGEMTKDEPGTSMHDSTRT